MSENNPQSGPRPDLDAITVLRSVDRRACNKLFVRQPDGSVSRSKANEGGSFVALTVPTPDLAAFASVVRDVGVKPDHMIILGVAIDAPPGAYRIIASAEMARHSGCGPDERAKLVGWHPVDGRPTICRLKENFAHSTIRLVDRDNAAGTPEAVAALSTADYLAALAGVFPGVDRCGRLVLPSSSTRVLDAGEPGQSGNAHIYVQVLDADDVDLRWQTAALRSRITTHAGASPWDDPIELAFAKPIHCAGAVHHHVCWPIFDPTVAGRERLVFDGSPKVVGSDLAVAPPHVELVAGPRLDLGLIKGLSVNEVSQIKAATQRITGKPLNIEFERAGSKPDRFGRPRISDIIEIVDVLAPDLEVDIGGGRMLSVQAFWDDANATHVRCESPYRPDSRSQAAFLGKHGDGTPFLFNSGTLIKYTIADEALRHSTPICLDWLDEKAPRFQDRDGKIAFGDGLVRRALKDVDVDSTLINRLRRAANRPRLKGGGINENQMPTFARKWLAVAWGDRKKDLPGEAAPEVLVLTRDEFGRDMLALFHTIIVGGFGCGHGQHSLAVWTLENAALQNAAARQHGGDKPDLVQFEDFLVWASIGAPVKDGSRQIEFAFRAGLAAQTTPKYPSIASLMPEELTKRINACGWGPTVAFTPVSGDDNRVRGLIDGERKQIRVTRLNSAFTDELGLSHWLSQDEQQSEKMKIVGDPPVLRLHRPK